MIAGTGLLGVSSDTQTDLHGDPFVAPGVVRFRRGVPRSFERYIRIRDPKTGARRLLARARKLGIPQAIDWFMIDTVAEGSSAWSRLQVTASHSPYDRRFAIDVSDTTEGYPADLDIARSYRQAETVQVQSDCSRDMESRVNKSDSRNSSAQFRPLPIIVVAKEGSSSPSSPWIVTRPSFSVTTEIELLEDSPNAEILSILTSAAKFVSLLLLLIRQRILF